MSSSMSFGLARRDVQIELLLLWNQGTVMLVTYV